MHPRSERGEPARGRGIGQDDRPGLGDRANRAGDAELIIVNPAAVECRLHGKLRAEGRRQLRPQLRIAVAVLPLIRLEQRHDFLHALQPGAMDQRHAFAEHTPWIRPVSGIAPGCHLIGIARISRPPR